MDEASTGKSMSSQPNGSSKAAQGKGTRRQQSNPATAVTAVQNPVGSYRPHSKSIPSVEATASTHEQLAQSFGMRTGRVLGAWALHSAVRTGRQDAAFAALLAAEASGRLVIYDAMPPLGYWLVCEREADGGNSQTHRPVNIRCWAQEWEREHFDGLDDQVARYDLRTVGKISPESRLLDASPQAVVKATTPTQKE